MKNKILKALAVVACAILLVVGSIAGTIAYLTSTATVTNTFTVGNVTITMAETDVDNDDDTSKNAYHLLPGQTYTKDPTITVVANSEDCYVFVKIVNDISAIEDSTQSIAAQLAANGWAPLEGVANVYTRSIVSKTDSDQKIPVFGTVTIASTVDNTTLADYNDKTVTVTAYAVQTAGFSSAKAAWTAAGFN